MRTSVEPGPERMRTPPMRATSQQWREEATALPCHRGPSPRKAAGPLLLPRRGL